MQRNVSRHAAIVAVVTLLSSAPVFAQLIPPPTGGGALLVPTPPPPPPPRIEVPVVPKLGDIPQARGVPVVPQLDEVPRTQRSSRNRRSFGDRITDCLRDGAAAGLNASDRAAYSRACANR
jgi:hypothetical protein